MVDATRRRTFGDPRFQHVKDLATPQEWDRDDTADPDKMLAGVLALYNIISAEKQSGALARATWVLAGATVGLAIATIVLVVATLNA